MFHSSFLNGGQVMCRTFTSGICLFLLIITSSCGGSKKNEADRAKVARVQSLFDEYLSALNSSIAKLGQVVDKDSAMSAAEELTKSAMRIREIAKELRSVDKLTKGEDAQLSEATVESAETADVNFSKSTDGLFDEGTLPPEAMEALRDALLDFSKAIREFSQATKALAP